VRGDPLVDEAGEIDAERLAGIGQNGGGHHPGMDKEFMTVEQVRSKLQGGQVRGRAMPQISTAAPSRIGFEAASVPWGTVSQR
jgi:hypothetical protein